MAWLAELDANGRFAARLWSSGKLDKDLRSLTLDEAPIDSQTNYTFYIA